MISSPPLPASRRISAASRARQAARSPRSIAPRKRRSNASLIDASRSRPSATGHRRQRSRRAPCADAGDESFEQRAEPPAFGGCRRRIAVVVDEDRHDSGVTVRIGEHQRHRGAVVGTQLGERLQRQLVAAGEFCERRGEAGVAAILVARNVHFAERRHALAARDEERRGNSGTDVEHVVVADHDHDSRACCRARAGRCATCRRTRAVQGLPHPSATSGCARWRRR